MAHNLTDGDGEVLCQLTVSPDTDDVQVDIQVVETISELSTEDDTCLASAVNKALNDYLRDESEKSSPDVGENQFAIRSVASEGDAAEMNIAEPEVSAFIEDLLQYANQCNDLNADAEQELEAEVPCPTMDAWPQWQPKREGKQLPRTSGMSEHEVTTRSHLFFASERTNQAHIEISPPASGFDVSFLPAAARAR